MLVISFVFSYFAVSLQKIIKMIVFKGKIT